MWIKEITSIYNQAYSYKDVKEYLVKSSMVVDESDKYYRTGINYFKFYIGKDENGTLKICNVKIPNNREIVYYDNSRTDAMEYISYRNELIFNIKRNDNNSIALAALENPEESVLVDEVCNPIKIRVKMTKYTSNLADENNIAVVDFKEYCKVVSYGEISTLHQSEALKACSMAIKMFAYYYVISEGRGQSYDISDVRQVFNPSKTPVQACTNAVEEIYDYFLLDSYGGVFPAFYRRSSASTDGEYCKKNGGILSQLEAEELASNYSWRHILEYYYTRVSGISYYNSGMSYGPVIITYSHIHDWSAGQYCSFCGAFAY